MRLEVSHIIKTYQGKTILNDCSFSFDRNITYVLMGANGCGKSTFLRICALLERPDSGAVAFTAGDVPLEQDMALRRRMTLVLPGSAFSIRRSSGMLHMVFNSGPRRAGDRGTGKECPGLRRSGTAAEPTCPCLLSSGETQRLGIARALVLDPEILFLDEPTASVDEENTEIIESIVGAMKKQGRLTVIMTTHDRGQAERIADRLLIMKHGRIEEGGRGNDCGFRPDCVRLP